VGLEIDGRVDVRDTVTLRGGLALTRAEMDGGADAAQLTGLRPAQAPRVGAVAGIDWRATPRLTLAAQGRYEGERFDDDLNSRALGAALVLDVRAEWAASENISLYAAADNLTDEDVEVSRTGDGVAGYGPPRLFRAGLTFRY
jgi:outer membrane receptor protein involved in Fe transport